MEDLEVRSDAEPDPEGGGEENHAEDEITSTKDVAEGAEKQQTGGVASLHQRGDVGGGFVGDVEVLCEDVEDGVVIVEVSDGEGAGEAEEDVHGGGEDGGIGRIPATPRWHPEEKPEYAAP